MSRGRWSGWRLAALLGAAVVGTGAHAGQYWDQGVRSKDVSVCFVGDALASRPGRVLQVMSYLRRFEHAANIRFPVAPVSCPAPATLPNGNEAYDGDIRVALPFTSGPWLGMVPGLGCRMFLDASGNYDGGNDGWGSWSNAPSDLAANRACQYNLKLGDDGEGGVPYLNHTLHEFGHALGLRHEHDRSDVDTSLGCSDSWFGGSGTSYLTRYDRRSVMHYKSTTCAINGNYDNTGLSDLDQMAVHLLYPEDLRVAEFIGTSVVAAGTRVTLWSAWIARGADMALVGRNFSWQVDGALLSNSPVLDVELPLGEHRLRYTHSDFLGRSFSYEGPIRVLAARDLAAQAAVVAALVPLM
jgi:hypothetical protein